MLHFRTDLPKFELVKFHNVVRQHTEGVLVVCRNVCRCEFNSYAYRWYVGTSVGVSLTRMRIGGMSERLSA